MSHLPILHQIRVNIVFKFYKNGKNARTIRQFWDLGNCRFLLDLLLRASEAFQTQLELFVLPTQNGKKRRTIRQKSSRPSGWRAKTANIHLHFEFTGKTAVRAPKPYEFHHFYPLLPKGPLRASGASTSTSWQASPQDPPKRPSRGPQTQKP